MKTITLTTAVTLAVMICSDAYATPVHTPKDFEEDLNYLEISGVMTVNDQRVSDYTVFLYRDGVLSDSFYVDNRREQYFGCEYGHDYMLKFVKPGYKERLMMVDTHLPDTAQLQDYTFRYSIAFLRKDAPSNTFDDFPVAYVMYDAKLKDFDYNKTYHFNVRNNARQTADHTASK